MLMFSLSLSLSYFYFFFFCLQMGKNSYFLTFLIEKKENIFHNYSADISAHITPQL